MTELDLAALVRDVRPPDAAARAAARARQDRLTKPTGALGRLEELSVWLAGVQGACPPRPPERPAVVVVVGDHGVARAGVSAYPPEVTKQMLTPFVAGGAAVSVLAGLVGASVRVVDLAVDADPSTLPAETGGFRVRRASGRIDVEDALRLDEAERALLAGVALADEAADSGADLLVPGDMGIGNTTPSAVLVGALTGAPADAVVGRGTGVDGAALARKRAVVADALGRARPVAADPLTLLATGGGADLAALVGLLLRAAGRGLPVVLDGVVVGAAALVAARVAPGVTAWQVAGHRSTEPAHALALDALGLRPVLDLELRLGEGTGALLAVPLLRAAAATLGAMATFDEARVSDRVGKG